MSASDAGRESYLTLDRQVCFALYSASRAFTNLYRPFLADLGLTYPQYLVMLVLWEREPVSVKDLGAALRLDSGTLSPLLKRLESAGLVTRVRSAGDERSVEVALTGDGRDLRRRAEHVPASMLCATGMPVDELDALRDTLDRLTAQVDAAAEQARSTLTDAESPARRGK
ncbi:MarR family transcriptional regulator [Saccharopolyspora erythraea NRRL 2338]|uniref:Transcriptional regulator, MarR-family n=2 Tax=Saccharopolyspora erythraea TaxID=1836 RepID=A4F666_SACEN|nr:MarR family transcriptional regulator [Saccharopolyspora erythraea]EQD88030.1 MarR family transcriptional regulator [Saccharopolyspora erythraea D]PFG93341.1 MarR family transcriptional regulator [Saccharopolyspora erythraea NRRL 2338]QRK90181.1 MarR family transcriptional regulator [Saccharopolyspora erythraea]CAL99540.1 transcriptional regulator, MarR-family [Saccharopolyspora erythraea NRRL 2338]